MPLNRPQQLFLDQARSDYAVYQRLSGCHPCHRLHYLQMSTEKLAKVHFWRRGVFPGFSHHVFAPFLRDLDTSRTVDFHLKFDYKDARRINIQKPAILNLAARIQNLAPGGKNNGPNPEYPWPPSSPTDGPLSHAFQEWSDWSETTPGRRLRRFVEQLLTSYSVFFP